MTEKLNLRGTSFHAPRFNDREVYDLQWQVGSAVNDVPDVIGLPSIDDTRYLFSTVKFHIGQIYRLLDTNTFIKNIEELYTQNAATKKANASRLWFVQLLLVLSLGKALLSRSRITMDPPGSKFFKRAMAMMPDHGTLWKDSLMAIDVLALAALYLYSIDLRESAHLFVCQAIRIAHLEGLHTQLPVSELGAEMVNRCRNLWWSLYIMDRHFSTSLGTPMATQDNDITTLLEYPSTEVQQDPTLVVQVRLWRLISTIATTVYKSEKTELSVFLEATRSILRALAEQAQEIERIVHINPQNSVEIISRGTRHIALLYHECLIYATRPLLLSVLMELLEFNRERTTVQDLLALARPVLSAGIRSAVKTLQILSDEDSILESFLPFDLEFLYAAAMHLLMARAIFPDMADNQLPDQQDADLVFDQMICKGNRVAQVRKTQLKHLETAFQKFTMRTKEQDLQTLSWTDSLLEPLRVESEAIFPQRQRYHQAQQERQQCGEGQTRGGGNVAFLPHTSELLSTDPPTYRDHLQPLENAELLDSIGISSDDFLNIAAHMDCADYNTFGFSSF
ncbi:MAG: hypothetical protein M1820_001714 [Bogoriella megaspora]|nr:MAG: hypothetical protein M1820_001714 [Bogoriella megaspora]